MLINSIKSDLLWMQLVLSDFGKGHQSPFTSRTNFKTKKGVPFPHWLSIAGALNDLSVSMLRVATWDGSPAGVAPMTRAAAFRKGRKAYIIE